MTNGLSARDELRSGKRAAPQWRLTFALLLLSVLIVGEARVHDSGSNSGTQDTEELA